MLLHFDLWEVGGFELLGGLDVVDQVVGEGLAWGEDFVFEGFDRLERDLAALADCCDHVVLNDVEPFLGQLLLLL